MKNRPLSILILSVGLWILAWSVRLDALPAATTGSDALGQHLVALTVQMGGGWPHPPNPEGGHSLWLLAAPLVAAAGSLEELFRLRFAVGALVAPLGALAAWLLATERGAMAAALGAGLVLALDPGLVDTLASSFRGYGAPELLALATLGGALVLRDRSWGLGLAVVGVVGATGQHPFAAGVALGGLLALPGLAPKLDRRAVAAAAAVAALCVLPRLAHLAWLADCGDGAVACLTRVATGSAEPDTPRGTMLQRALHDRVLVEGWWPWVALAAGGVALCVRPVARRRPAALWALGGLVGILGMGLWAQSLRPYHLRMAMPGLAVAAAVGLSRWSPAPVALAVLALLAWGPGQREPLARATWTPRAVDRLALDTCRQDPDIGRVRGAWWGPRVGLDPDAFALSAWLQGRCALGPTAGPRTAILAHDPPEDALSLLPPEAERLTAADARPVLFVFPTDALAEQWLAAARPVDALDGESWRRVVAP